EVLREQIFSRGDGRHPRGDGGHGRPVGIPGLTVGTDPAVRATGYGWMVIPAQDKNRWRKGDNPPSSRGLSPFRHRFQGRKRGDSGTFPSTARDLWYAPDRCPTLRGAPWDFGKGV